MNRLDWLKKRQAGISASDAADLIGCGYNSALQLYRKKVEPVTEDDANPRAGWRVRGLALEPVVADLYAERMECGPLVPDYGDSGEGFILHSHPDRPWQTCTPDRFRQDGRYVELKTCVSWEDWGAPGSDVIPDVYTVQTQQSMGVMMLDSCDVAALNVMAWEFRPFRIAFNPAFFAWLTSVEERFMTDHLIPRIAPGPEWDLQFSQAPELAAIIRGKSIDLGSEVAELLEQRAVYKSIRDEADDEYSRLNGRLAALMGDSQRAYAEGPAGAWKLSQVEIGEKQIPAHTSRGYRYVRATPTKRRGLVPIGAKTMPALMAEIAAGMELTDPLSNLETS